jgi:hypothetical protein
MPTSARPSLTAVAVIAALLVLCLGVPRMLVFCTGPHSEGRIEFAHASECCCGKEHEEADSAGSEPRCVPADGHEHCVDLALGLGIGPLPERVVVEHDSPPLLCAVPPTAVLAGDVAAAALRPPTTGPPRPDPSTALRATTLLQI